MTYIAYVRVSTDRQGRSGLGLEAQQAAIRNYVFREGGTVLAEYREVESGRVKARPELLRAIGHCERTGATLLVAKLDRLSRNMAFLSTLMDSDLDFRACDMPSASRLTLHILAAVAEDEARRASERTKAALAALKARGATLGRPQNFSYEHQVRGAERQREDAANAYGATADLIAEWRAQGLTLMAIAQRLNAKGVPTRLGAQWSTTQVRRVLGRMPGIGQDARSVAS